MMENQLSCALVRDLLPLYAEGMVSEDTRNLLEAHLTTCTACREVLENLRQIPPAPAEPPPAPLKQIRRRFRLLEWLIAALCGMLVLVIAGVAALQMWTVEYSYADLHGRAVKITAYDGKTIHYCLDNMPPVQVNSHDWTDFTEEIVKPPCTTADKQGITYIYSIRTNMWNHLFGERQRLVLCTIGPNQPGGSHVQMAERELPGSGRRIYVSLTADIRYLDPDGSLHRLFGAPLLPQVLVPTVTD